MSLERYRQIIPDWRDFEDCIRTREPTAFRVRTGFISGQDLRTRLQRQGFQTRPVAGVPDYFRVESGPGSIAQTLEHWIGLFHVQQSVMGLPSLALAPVPDERVLDLCAAPGGKTAHLAELMQDRGPLVAVDRKEKRIRGLLANLYRLGHPNVLVIAGDGRQVPSAARFDRVLVDAPCSAEGNVRRQRGRLPERGAGFAAYVTSLQEALLRRAVRVTRPGGVIVYATCTFAPEENEAVVDRILRECPVELEEIPLAAPHAPGLDAWGGMRFHPDLQKAWRVYPHHLDSGGLFMARLRRLPSIPAEEEVAGAPGEDGWSAIPTAFPGQDPEGATARIEAARSELELRFGMRSSLLDRLGWMVRTGNIWAHTARTWPVPAWQAEEATTRWRVVSLGLRALRQAPSGRETPSNQFLGRWGGELADERKVEVGDAQLLSLLEIRAPLPGPFPTGPVALVRDGRVLGRGMVGRGGLVSEIPRVTASRLLQLLRATPDTSESGEGNTGGSPSPGRGTFG